MPRGDGTGPWGQGPSTGWGRGCCVPFVGGQRSSWRRGFRQMMPWNWGQPSNEDISSEIGFLEKQIEQLKSMLKKD